MNIKRQFFQIYTEIEPQPRITRHLNTFRAKIIQELSKHILREYIPQNKNRYGFQEDVIRTSNPEAEIKIGFSCQSLYFQVSTTNQEETKPLHEEFMQILKEWENPHK